ncbi:hypothetical protein Tco_0402195, partial [Tanacetum coccineum]
SVTQQNQAEFPKLDSSLAVPMQPFKMEESQFNKFKEDKLRVLMALEIEELLQPQGETMHGQEKVVKCYNCLVEGHMVK